MNTRLERRCAFFLLRKLPDSSESIEGGRGRFAEDVAWVLVARDVAVRVEGGGLERPWKRKRSSIE
jgi:hypothetical protein